MTVIHTLRSPGPWWRRGGKYAAVLRVSMANHFAYAGEALLRLVFLVLIIFVFVQLWSVTYGVLGAQRIGNYTMPQMIWYFSFAEAIVTASPFLRRKVDDEVKSGELAYRLTKPYHYVCYLAADYLGEWLARFTLNMVVAVSMSLIMVGPIPFTVAGSAMTAVVLVGAVALDFMGACAVSLLAFWVEDTASFYLIYRRLVMLLGGMMIPLDVFPEPLSSIARALPFSYIVYGPARLWAATDPAFFLSVLPGLTTSLLVGGAIVALIFRAGQRNVTVNGG